VFAIGLRFRRAGGADGYRPTLDAGISRPL
jgi:hypothetical protein